MSEAPLCGASAALVLPVTGRTGHLCPETRRILSCQLLGGLVWCRGSMFVLGVLRFEDWAHDLVEVAPTALDFYPKTDKNEL